MPTKDILEKEHIEYHKDGSIWAKGQTANGVPVGYWELMIRNTVQPPSDKALFQLGENQICVFDPATRRVALLWRGRGPVAVMEKANAKPGL